MSRSTFSKRTERGLCVRRIALSSHQRTPFFPDVYKRQELDWLLYNKPLEYAQMVLRGEMEHYLSLGCDHGRLEN